MENNNEMAVFKPKQNTPSIFTSLEAFDQAQRFCKMLCNSDMVPKNYQGESKIPNAMVALEMAMRTNTSPIVVMQNVDVIHGNPGWKSQFIIALINSCGRFTPLKFEMKSLGEKVIEYSEIEYAQGQKKKVIKSIKINDVSCIAFAKDKEGKEVRGPKITIEMAVKEGWYTKDGSKWQTITELMLNYRSAAFFGRINCPDVLQGMHTVDEIIDITPTGETSVNSPGTPAAVTILNQKASPPAEEVQGQNEELM